MFENVIDNIPKTYVDESSTHGYGLFAREALAMGCTLVVLDGQVVPWQRYGMGNLEDEWNALSQTSVLLRPYRTKYFYINHSRTPNLTVVREVGCARVGVATLRSIAAGEELLLDYRNEPLPTEYIETHGGSYL